MKTDEITVRVGAEAADAYRTASEEDRRKLEVLISLRLREATRDGGSLKELMRQISRKAQERGLTGDVLDAILNEE